MNDNAAQKFKIQLRQYADELRLDENTGLFPLDSEWRRLSFSFSTVFGAPRALLLQVAHPIIAQGVYDHSEFDTNPAKRAIRTFLGVWAVALGKQSTSIDIATKVFEAHLPVKGTIPGYKPEMADRKYSAMNPEANLWVWATLVEGVLFGHREVKHRIARERLERMYEESKVFGLAFNVKRSLIPATLADFEAYFQRVLDHDLEVTPAGKEVGDALLDGARFPFTLGRALYRTGAVETLPPAVTKAFGWSRTAFTRTLYGFLRGVMRIPYAILPEFMTTGAIAWIPNIRRALFGPGIPRPALASASSKPLEEPAQPQP